MNIINYNKALRNLKPYSLSNNNNHIFWNGDSIRRICWLRNCYCFSIGHDKYGFWEHDQDEIPVTHAEKKLITSATIFTVSWNCTNFWIFVYTERPHFATLTILEKLSSNIMTSALDLATCTRTWSIITKYFLSYILLFYLLFIHVLSHIILTSF